MPYRGDEFFTAQGWFSRLLDQQGWFDRSLADDPDGQTTITGTSDCQAAAPTCEGSGSVVLPSFIVHTTQDGSGLFGFRDRRRRPPVVVVGVSELHGAAPSMRSTGRVLARVVGASRLQVGPPSMRGRGSIDRAPIDEEELLQLGVF